MKKWRIAFLSFLLAFVLSGCGGDPTPAAPTATAAPASGDAEVAADDVVDTPVPTESAPTVTAPPPTETATAEAPLIATPTPSETEPPPATEMPAATLALLEPVEGAAVSVGADLFVSGTAGAGVATVNVVLRAGAHVLAEGELAVIDGAWSGMLAVPPNVTGPAQLTVDDGVDSAGQTVSLVRPIGTPGSAIQMNQPPAGWKAVAGYVLFFDGTVTAAIGETVNIGVLVDDCQTIAASQSFTVTGGTGTWRGLVIIPQTVTGPACAVAYTGTYGAGSWREVQAPLTILDLAEMEVGQLWLGNPAGLTIPSGGTVFLYGAAIGAPAGSVLVEIVAENGTILASTTASPNDFGYWETNAAIFETAPGAAIIRMTMGAGDAQVVTTVAVEVE